MSNLYKGPSIEAFYHISVHLAMRFQKRRILEIVQPETRIGSIYERSSVKIAHFCPDPLKNMATIGNYCF
jgi:hypothetical protein